jgi:hypothetical protein
VTGTVAAVIPQDDGDYHVDLQLDRGEEGLLNGVNVADVNDEIVTEIVPADQSGCAPGQPVGEDNPFDVGTCTGADVTIPKVGQRVSEVGPYVLDTNHGWMEIHPVWSVTDLHREAAPCTYILGFATLYD